MSDKSPPSLWRTVRTNPPTENDFLSHRELGRPQRRATIEEWEGVSTFDDPTLISTTIEEVYELWDTETGNLITDFADEQAAIMAVRTGVDEEGYGAWLPVALVRVEPDGQRDTIVRGDALIARAFAGLADPERIRAALTLLDALANPTFRRALNELRVAIATTADTLLMSVDDVRDAVLALSRAAGVPVRVETEGPRLALVTPDRTMAELLAAGVPPLATQSDTAIRSVTGGYAVDIAA